MSGTSSSSDPPNRALSSPSSSQSTVPEPHSPSGDHTSTSISRQHSLLYKNSGLDVEFTRRRQERNAVQLRKQHKDDAINQRRVRFSAGFREVLQEEYNLAKSAQRIAQQEHEIAASHMIKEQFSHFVECMRGDQYAECIVRIRELLSDAPQPPIEEALEAGVLNPLLSFLATEKDPVILFQLVWIVTNLTSGSAESTEYVLSFPVVDLLVNLLHQHNETASQPTSPGPMETSSVADSPTPSERPPSTWRDVHAQVMGALGNIAGNGATARHCLVERGLPGLLLNYLQKDVPLQPVTNSLLKPDNLLRQCVWCLSNLARFLQDVEEGGAGVAMSPGDSYAALMTPQVLPHVAVLLSRCPQEEDQLLSDLCWTMLSMASGPESRLEALLQTGVIRFLLQLLVHVSPEVSMSALRVLGLLVTGDDAHTEVAVSAGLLPCLGFLLSTARGNDSRWKQQICWVLSNITAGCRAHKQAVIDARLLPLVVELMNQGDFRTRREALWVVRNLVTACSQPQLRYAIEEAHCLPPLCHLLTVHDNATVLLALECLRDLLHADSNEKLQEKYAHLWEECGGLAIVEYLQGHPNEDVYAKAHSIVDEFYHKEEHGDKNAVGVDLSTGPKSGLVAFSSNGTSDGTELSSQEGERFSF